MKFTRICAYVKKLTHVCTYANIIITASIIIILLHSSTFFSFTRTWPTQKKVTYDNMIMKLNSVFVIFVFAMKSKSWKELIKWVLAVMRVQSSPEIRRHHHQKLRNSRPRLWGVVGCHVGCTEVVVGCPRGNMGPNTESVRSRRRGLTGLDYQWRRRVGSSRLILLICLGYAWSPHMFHPRTWAW